MVRRRLPIGWHIVDGAPFRDAPALNHAWCWRLPHLTLPSPPRGAERETRNRGEGVHKAQRPG
jgi:hypothetical protein